MYFACAATREGKDKSATPEKNERVKMIDRNMHASSKAGVVP
jgi:hypothetical protein